MNKLKKQAGFDQRSWIKINSKNLERNFKNLTKNLSDPKIKKLAVVKSNAYGHGIIECAKIFSQAGADFLGVDCLEEAIQIRQAQIKKPILVLGWTPPENFQLAGKNDISITISSINSLQKIKSKIKTSDPKLKVHLKIDTGLHRQGLLKKEIQESLKFLQKNKNIVLEGLYSHLASAENPKDILFTQKQSETFLKTKKAFEQSGFNPICHLSASAASILYPEMNYDMVRFGIALYGLWPSIETQKESRKAKKDIKLFPALNWQTKITEIKKVKKGEGLGYNLSEKVKRNSVIGMIPIGYWHGYPRHASSKAHVLVNGQKIKILGKISMDMTIVDLTDVKNPKSGDIVTIIGKDKDKFVSAEELADASDTINYEIVTRLNSQITRIYS